MGSVTCSHRKYIVPLLLRLNSSAYCTACCSLVGCCGALRTPILLLWCLLSLCSMMSNACHVLQLPPKHSIHHVNILVAGGAGLGKTTYIRYDFRLSDPACPCLSGIRPWDTKPDSLGLSALLFVRPRLITLLFLPPGNGWQVCQCQHDFQPYSQAHGML